MDNTYHGMVTKASHAPDYLSMPEGYPEAVAKFIVPY
jgi:hypothetical protein